MIPPPGASNVYPMPAWCRLLPHTLFLLPIRRMSNPSESQRSTRDVVSLSLVLAWRLQQQRHRPALSALFLGHVRTQYLHALLAVLYSHNSKLLHRSGQLVGKCVRLLQVLARSI